jgi:hypothetical protein
MPRFEKVKIWFELIDDPKLISLAGTLYLTAHSGTFELS